MTLKGNLREVSIIQILNLITLAKKSGTLDIEISGDKISMSFREGKLSYAQCDKEENSLADILHRNNKLSLNQYRIIKNKAVGMSDKELGLLLVNAGYISQEDILTSLANYFSGIVRRLFSWVEGVFKFEPGKFQPEGKIPVRIGLENLIIEGSRQSRELEQLQDEIPSLEMGVKFAQKPENIRNLNLSVEEWRVISYIDPKNTILQIARATKLNDLEIRRVIYSLLQAGVVEIVRPVKASSGIFARMFATSDRDEQKSILNRLIHRVRSL